MTTFCVPSAAIDAATSRTIWTPGSLQNGMAFHQINGRLLALRPSMPRSFARRLLAPSWKKAFSE